MARRQARRADGAHLRPLRRAASRAARVCGTARRSSRRFATDGSTRAARWTTKASSFCTSRRSRRISPSRGTLPVNVIVLAEGEEEVGSEHLAAFIEANKDLLACDAVVISDSAMFAPGLPSILSSLRGLAYFQIDVQGPATDLHSGSYGGAVMNPAMALARILATIHDADGHVAIPGFYDTVRDWGEARAQADSRAAVRRRALSRRDGLAGAVRREGILHARARLDAPDVRGERPAQRLHRRRREDRASGQGDGEGELPPRSPISIPNEIETLMKAHVARVAPKGVTVTVTHLHGGRPWRADLGRAAVRRRAPRAGDGVLARAGDHRRRRLDPGRRRFSATSSARRCCSSASACRARTRTRRTSG